LADGPSSLKQTSEARGRGKIRELPFIVLTRKKSNSLKKAVGAGFTYSFEDGYKHLCYMSSMCFRFCFFLRMF
jgi:hypothetical protein